MTVDTTGNVGIGTSTPSEKFEVNGNLKLSAGTPTISAASYITIPNGAYFSGLPVYAESAIRAR